MCDSVTSQVWSFPITKDIMRLGEEIIKLSTSNLALNANHKKAYLRKETENAPQYTLNF